MAPKRFSGGGSSSSNNSGGSSSSACELCSIPITLTPEVFDTTIARVVLALECLSILVIIACMIVVARRPWLEMNGKKERFKYWTYMGSGLSAVLYLAIAVVDSILHQIELRTIGAYSIIYIFRSLTWRVSDVLMIAVILRCLEGGRSAMIAKRTKLRIVHWIAIGIAAILAIVAWSLHTKFIAATLSADPSPVDNTGPIELTYSAVVFVISLEMVAVALFLIGQKAIPKTVRLLLAGIAVSYSLGTLLTLIFFATIENNYLFYSASLAWANSFISLITLMAVFILLATLSRLSNNRTRQYTGDRGHVASVNATTPNTWAASPQQNHQGFNADTTYHGGGYQGQEWLPGNGQGTVGSYSNTNSHDPAAQPLYLSEAPAVQPDYPSQAYNPPQQTSHIYDSAGTLPYVPEQRFYGNGSGYASIPQHAR